MPYSNISLSVSQSTHNDIELYPLYRILVGLYVCIYRNTKISNTIPTPNTGRSIYYQLGQL